MASPTPKRQAQTSRYPPRPATSPPEVVDPRWLLKALGVVLLAAVVCAYLAVCLLVYQGAWQLVLAPSHIVKQTPAGVGVPFQPVRFDAGAGGKPRLTGWWIPADSASAPTILFLHDGAGTLSDSVERLALLHRANVNIFAIDYRGFGESDPPHPTEKRMKEDVAAALDYLVNTRHLPVSRIVPQGVGLGASLAAGLAISHPDLGGVVLDNPDPDAKVRAIQNGRASLLPMHLLVGEPFDVSRYVLNLKQPKLLIAGGLLSETSTVNNTDRSLFHSAPEPKISVTLAGPNTQAEYVASISRFLDEYVTSH